MNTCSVFNENGIPYVNMCVVMLCSIGYENVALYVHRAKLSYGVSCCIAVRAAAFDYAIGDY